MMHLSPARRRLLWAAVVSGLLLSMLDQTIVGTALPEIVGELGGPSWYVWAFTAYLVPATVLLPVAARLSDRWGRRSVLLLGTGAFVAGSVVCAAAPTMAVLTTGRAVQGAGAAALEALAFVMVSELSGGGRNAGGQAALAGAMTFSFVAGPLIGGLLTDHVDWRAAFLVNVPIGLAAMVVVRTVLPRGFGRTEGRETPFDVLGTVTLSAAIGALLVGLSRHQVAGDWSAPSTGGLVLAGLAGLALLGWVESRAAAPIIPLRLLRDPVTGRLIAAAAVATTGLYVGVLLLPRWYQDDLGVSATMSGVRVYPLLLGLLVAVNVGAALVVRRGEVRRVLTGAAALTLLGALGFATLGADSPAVWPLLLMAVLGCGMGPMLSGLQIAVGRTTAPRDLGAAMGTLLLGRQVVGAFALAAGEAWYVAGLDRGAGQASSTGTAIAVVAGAGALLAMVVLAGLRGEAGRLPVAAVSGPPRRPAAASRPRSRS
jgi:EmrB/QacA subfamily drug resistance transporter